MVALEQVQHHVRTVGGVSRYRTQFVHAEFKRGSHRLVEILAGTRAILVAKAGRRENVRRQQPCIDAARLSPG